MSELNRVVPSIHSSIFNITDDRPTKKSCGSSSLSRVLPWGCGRPPALHHLSFVYMCLTRRHDACFALGVR